MMINYFSSSVVAMNYLSSYFSWDQPSPTQNTLDTASQEPVSARFLTETPLADLLIDDYEPLSPTAISSDNGTNGENLREVDKLEAFDASLFETSFKRDNIYDEWPEIMTPSESSDDINILKQSFYLTSVLPEKETESQSKNINCSDEKIEDTEYSELLNNLDKVFTEEQENIRSNISSSSLVSEQELLTALHQEGSDDDDSLFIPSIDLPTRENAEGNFLIEPNLSENTYTYSDTIFSSQNNSNICDPLDLGIPSCKDPIVRKPLLTTAIELSLSALKRISFFQTAVYDTRRASIMDKIVKMNQISDENSQIFSEVFSGRRGGKSHDAGVVFLKENRIYIVFKGTENLDDWKKNLTFAPLNLKIKNFGTVAGSDYLFQGSLHQGFIEAFLTSWANVQRAIVHVIRQAERDINDLSFIFVGHSLGGAQATIGALAIMGHTILGQPVGINNAQTNQVKLVTFGSPKVFQNDSSHQVEQLLGKDNIIRFVEENDPVAQVPQAIIGYRHIGTLHTFNAQNIKNIDSQENRNGKNILRKMINTAKDKLADPLVSHSNQTYFKYINYYFDGFNTTNTSPKNQNKYHPSNYDHAKLNHSFMMEQSMMIPPLPHSNPQ